MEEMLEDIEGVVQYDWIAQIIMAVIIIAVTAVVAYMAGKFMRSILHLNDGKGLPSGSIFVNIIIGAVWFLGICIMLSVCFSVDVSAALTALGIGGIAVSLGFKDTLSNLIGGLQVSLMRIVSPGDNIQVGSSSGVVKDVSWRHTTIVTTAGEEVIIPNSVINTTALVHLPDDTKVELPIVIPGDVEDLDVIADDIERAAAEAAGRVATLTKEPSLKFSSIDPGSFKGTLTFRVEDAQTASSAGDAALRAIAPLVKQAEGAKTVD